MAWRLKSCLREVDTLARISGDEFTVTAGGLKNAQDASLVAETILKALRAPFQVENQELYVTASVGISLYPRDAIDAETLQRNADSAMYRAKSRGKNRFEYFLAEMSACAASGWSWRPVFAALDRGEFFPHYQPQFNLQSETGGPGGAVALTIPAGRLARPVHSDRRGEQLIVPIGTWVSCRRLAGRRPLAAPDILQGHGGECVGGVIQPLRFRSHG